VTLATGGWLAAAGAAAGVLVTNWLFLPREHRDLRFFMQYGAIYMILLVPAKLYAMSTPLADTWGTRGRVPATAASVRGAAT
jgi:hypothetical protein